MTRRVTWRNLPGIVIEGDFHMVTAIDSEFIAAVLAGDLSLYRFWGLSR